MLSMNFYSGAGPELGRLLGSDHPVQNCIVMTRPPVPAPPRLLDVFIDRLRRLHCPNMFVVRQARLGRTGPLLLLLLLLAAVVRLFPALVKFFTASNFSWSFLPPQPK